METNHLRVLQLARDEACTEKLANALSGLARPCSITLARTGPEFAAAWGEGGRPYDLVISALHAPGHDGLDALATVRATAPAMPFLFITPPMADRSALDLLRAGASDLVPSDRLEELPFAVERALRAKDAEHERIAARATLVERNALLQTITQAHGLVLGHDDWRQACAVLLRHALATTGANCGLLGVREHPDRLAALFVGVQGAEWREMTLGDDPVSRAVTGGQTVRVDEERGLVLASPWPRLSALRAVPLQAADDVVGVLAVGRVAGALDRRAELTLETLAPACAVVASTRRRGVLERELQEQFQQAQKLEAVGRLAGGVAHDFNNLLSVINGYTELTLDELPDGHPVRGSIEQIARAGHRAAGLTRQLLLFSRKSVVHLVPTRLDESVRNLRKMLTRIVGEDVELALETPDALDSVVCDVGQLEQAITNLVVNARDAMERGGTITLSVGQLEVDATRPHPRLKAGRYATVAVRDTGCGMDQTVARQIFEPFFTTKEAGKGTGLGLSTVYSIMQMHHGTVDVTTAPGAGSTFTLYFPVTDATPAAESDAAKRADGGLETVLVIEDDDELRGLVRAVLSRAGYTVMASASGDAAARLSDDELADVDVVLTDVVMPGMRGPECADVLRRRRPDLPVVYMSGYADTSMISPGQLERLFPLLQKPVSPAKLLASLREMLDGRQRAQSASTRAATVATAAATAGDSASPGSKAAPSIP